MASNLEPSDVAGTADSEPLPIRAYADGDEDRLVELFASAYGGRRIDPSHWRWKLVHPQSPVPNVWLAMAAERPVFQYAGIPTAFRMDGAEALAMVSVDTMTAPDFRRRGLLTQVATQTYACWREAGIDFVIGLPNEKWGSRNPALGLKPLFPLRWLTLPLHPQALLARRLSMPWLRRLSAVSVLWGGLRSLLQAPDPGVRIQRVEQAGAEFDRLWERCKDDARFAFVRDRRWVQWRFLSCPSRRYEVRLAMRGAEPVGYCAHHVAESGRGVFIAEIMCARADDAVRDALLADLLAAQPEAEYFTTLAAPGTPSYRWLRRRAFFKGPDFTVHVVPLSARVSLDAMRRPEHWELSGAAFDAI